MGSKAPRNQRTSISRTKCSRDTCDASSSTVPGEPDYLATQSANQDFPPAAVGLRDAELVALAPGSDLDGQGCGQGMDWNIM